MGRKCSVFKCQSGYQYVSRKRKAELENLNHETVVQKTESVKTYSFPEDKEECASWLRALPNSNLTYEEVQKKSKNGCPSKCPLHWPPGVPTKLRNNHQVAQYFLLIYPRQCFIRHLHPLAPRANLPVKPEILM